MRSVREFSELGDCKSIEIHKYLKVIYSSGSFDEKYSSVREYHCILLACSVGLKGSSLPSGEQVFLLVGHTKGSK